MWTEHVLLALRSGAVYAPRMCCAAFLLGMHVFEFWKKRSEIASHALWAMREMWFGGAFNKNRGSSARCAFNISVRTLRLTTDTFELFLTWWVSGKFQWVGVSKHVQLRHRECRSSQFFMLFVDTVQPIVVISAILLVDNLSRQTRLMIHKERVYKLKCKSSLFHW